MGRSVPASASPSQGSLEAECSPGRGPGLHELVCLSQSRDTIFVAPNVIPSLADAWQMRFKRDIREMNDEEGKRMMSRVPGLVSSFTASSTKRQNRWGYGLFRVTAFWDSDTTATNVNDSVGSTGQKGKIACPRKGTRYDAAQAVGN